MTKALTFPIWQLVLPLCYFCIHVVYYDMQYPRYILTRLFSIATWISEWDCVSKKKLFSRILGNKLDNVSQKSLKLNTVAIVSLCNQDVCVTDTALIRHVLIVNSFTFNNSHYRLAARYATTTRP